MTHASAIDALQGSISSIIREQIGSDRVIDVLVRRDEFEDDVLIVTVIIDDGNGELDEDDVLGLVRHLRPQLAADGETAFPLISFSTDREHKDAA